MGFHLILRGLLAAALLFVAQRCRAQSDLGAGNLCRTAIATAEAEQHIPDAFLSAIAKVESGRPIDGMIVPWPWTINAEGVGSVFATKEEAIAAVQALQARGVRSIDVGCLQVNLNQHPQAFHALDQAFDPVTNARYAAGLLLTLFGQTGSWPLAAAAYHSQTPTLGAAYQKQVLAAWAVPDRPGARPHASPNPSQLAGTSPAAIGSATSFSATPAFGRENSFMTSQQPRPGVVRANGRSLADYRAIPTQIALRMPGKPG